MFTKEILRDQAIRQALRIAFAVAGGLTISVMSGSSLPFLAPMFAAQFLFSSRKPLQLGQAIGMVVLIVVVGQFLVLATSILGERPLVIALLLWLIYFACFMAQAEARGGGAVFLILVIAVMIPLLGILQIDLGQSIILVLAAAAISGALLSWLAHALFPETAEELPQSPPPRAEFPLVHSILNASVLLGIVVWCLVDSRFATAIVVPITVASLLGQMELAKSQRAALGLIVVNLLGGVVASIVFSLLSIRPELHYLFLVTFLIALTFGYAGVSKPETGKLYAGALSTFLVLLGLGISPLPTSTPESFTTRIGFVAFAIAYTLCALALLGPIVNHFLRRETLGVDDARSAHK